MRLRIRCKLLGHHYVRVRYPDSPDGYYLRCLRCHKERDTGARIAVVGIQ
ncbi:hypothetical protein [Angustibacter peucedani]